MEAAEELKEELEKVRDVFDKRVAATMAVIAAALAVVSVLGHVATTEELLYQQRASDQWSFYQAKNIRRYESQIAADVFSALKAGPAAQYQGNAGRYQHEEDEIQKQAQEFEKESHTSGARAMRLHAGEVFLEISIVLASLAILTKRRVLYWSALAGSIIGVVIAITAALVR